MGEAPRDVSRVGCRNMASNGFEWTRDLQFTADQTIPLPSGVQKTAKVYLMGQDYLESSPLTFNEMRKPKSQNYLETSPHTSFRVVLDRE